MSHPTANTPCEIHVQFDDCAGTHYYTFLIDRQDGGLERMRGRIRYLRNARRNNKIWNVLIHRSWGTQP